MVTTGGGPGVMAAATAGAGLERSFAININLPFEYDSAGFAADDPKVVHSEFFFTRKLAFFRQSDAFVVFPGGLGTMDELFEALTLIQTKKIGKFPIVLVDKDYWQGLMDWVTKTFIKEGMIDKNDMNLFKVADSADEAVQHINEFYSRYLLKPNF
jgi:uncharacterized protein (TIGR00730 family)